MKNTLSILHWAFRAVAVVGAIASSLVAQAQQTTVSFSLVGLDGKPLPVASTPFRLAAASYQVTLGAVDVKTNANGTTTTLLPGPYALTGQLTNSYDVAYGLLRNLRQAAVAAGLSQAGLAAAGNDYGAQLLFPHRYRRFSWWPATIFSKAEVDGNKQELRVRDLFLQQLSSQLQKEWQKATAMLLPAAGSPALTQLSPGTVLYATEKPLATTAGTRLLHLTIRDLGAHVLASGARRYLVCASYATSIGEYASNRVAGGCPSMPRYAVATAELENLSQRDFFVKGVAAILDTANLWRVDGLSSVALGEIETRKAALAQRQQATVVASLRQREAQAAFDADSRASSVSGDFINHVVALMAANSDQAAALAAETTPAAAVRADFITSRRAIKASVLNHDIVSLSTTEEASLQSMLTDVFIDFTKQQERSTAAPMAGILEIQRDVPVQDNTRHPTTTAVFLPDSIQVVIEDGNVEELKAVGQVNGQSVLFETYAPIGISSDRDLRTMWPRQLLWAQTKPAGFGGKRACIRLTDLLHYTAAMQANGKDRSPADGVYTLHPTDGLARRSLPKLTTTKLLQARVYTDLGGISGQNKPNGLVQLEISKKLEWGVGWSKRWRPIQVRAPGYFMPLVAVTKIEQQNRFLPLLRAPGTVPRYTINTIDLLRYTNLRVGGDINLMGMRWASLKSDFYLDASIYLNRVDIRDSVQRPNTTKLMRVDSSLNVVMYGIGLVTRFRPDSRYGVQSRIGFYRYNLVNNLDQNNQVLIEQRPYITGLNPEAHTQWDKYRYQGVMQYELLAWASLSENSRVFFRPQFSHLLFQSNHTYFQFQLGYQFDVFADSDKREKQIPVKSLW